MTTDSKLSRHQSGSDDKETMAARLREAGLLENRLIPVEDGSKASKVSHHKSKNRHNSFDRLHGNYGVYAGATPSGDKWLIDVDIDDYGETDSEALEAVTELPETLTVASPHTDGVTGGHRYYVVVCDDLPEQIKELTGAYSPKPSWGELRVRNQYVVGPGSQLDGCDKEWCDECEKPDGGKYEIAKDAPIAELQPEQILDVLRADGYSRETAENDTGDYTPDTDDDNRAKRVVQQDSKIAEYLSLGAKAAGFRSGDGGGDRSDADLYTCCKMVEYGVSEEQARDLLNGSSFTKVNERGSKYWRETWNEALRKADKNSKQLPNEDEENATTGWDEVKQLFESDEKGTTTEAYGKAAELLSKEHDFVTIRNTSELYYYNPDLGYYVRKGETFLREQLDEVIPHHINNNRWRNIRDRVRSANYIDSDEFHPPKGKVCVQNGVLDLNDNTLEPHSPDYYFTSRLQTPYDPDAESDLWPDFLSESVGESEQEKLEEFIGYCLETWHHNREKNLFIVGPRQSGKSTYLHVLQALFGTPPTVINLTPQQIADTQFDAASLKEAMLNAVNDINSTKIEDSGTLKRVFSGERLKLERKHQDADFGAPTAKHAFTANWLPSVVGQDESLYRRVLIVEFPNKIDDNDRDEDLKPKLAGGVGDSGTEYDGELSGILNRVIDARNRLHDQGGFTNDRDDSDTRRKWDSWQDAHKRFLYQQFEITGDSDDTVDKDTYYRAYKEFAGREGYELKPKQGVTKSLKWVPEIGVHDNEYSGLIWREEDAADESTQAMLSDTQDERVSKVLAWVEGFTDPDGTPADRQEILDHADEQGLDPSNVDHTIENLLAKGELERPQSGTLRRVNP